MKPHYTCAIKVAYMAKYFGVNILGHASTSTIMDNNPPFYIHPDSLHIFEPQDGDVCELAGDDQYYSSISGDYAEVYMSYVGYYNPVAISLNALAELRDGKAQIAKIIQRNNKPFFMYEV